ncbi:MAG: hypothetical protein M1840_006190 [Geoglossum simile]|nr:MAG: hypothetical protein M1840_006190 [Geoglossum simile]
MLFSYAHTVPINPANSTPRLSKHDVWTALLDKARRPQDYIPIIASCKVTSQRAGGLTRNVIFHAGSFMPAEVALEEEVDFVIRDQGPYHIANVLSHGDADGELYLSFVFDFEKPHIALGTPDATDLEQALRAGAAQSVRGFVDGVREKIRKAGEVSG